MAFFHLLTVCEDVQRDVLIILDSTHGILSKDFHSQKNFIEILLNEINETKIKLTIQVYSDEQSCPTFTSHDNTKTIQGESDHDKIRDKLSILKFELSTFEYDYNCVWSLIKNTTNSFAVIFTRSQFIANDESLATEKFTKDQLLCVVFAQDGTKNVFPLDLTNSNFGSIALSISRLFCNSTSSKVTDEDVVVPVAEKSTESTSFSHYNYFSSTSDHILNEITTSVVTSTEQVKTVSSDNTMISTVSVSSDQVVSSTVLLVVPSKSLSQSVNRSTDNNVLLTSVRSTLSQSIDIISSIHPSSPVSIIPAKLSSEDVAQNESSQSFHVIETSPSPFLIVSSLHELLSSSPHVSIAILPTKMLMEASSLSFVNKIIESSATANVSHSLLVNGHNTGTLDNLTSTYLTSLNITPSSSQTYTSELSSTMMVGTTNSTNTNFTFNQGIQINKDSSMIVNTSRSSVSEQISIMSSTILPSSKLITNESDFIPTAHTETSMNISSSSRIVLSDIIVNKTSSYIASTKSSQMLSMSRNESSQHLPVTTSTMKRVNASTFSSLQISLNISKSVPSNETIYHTKGVLIDGNSNNITNSTTSAITPPSPSPSVESSNRNETFINVNKTSHSSNMTSYILPSSFVIASSSSLSPSTNQSLQTSSTPPLDFEIFSTTARYVSNSTFDSTNKNNISTMPSTFMPDNNNTMFNSSLNISLLSSNRREIFPSKNTTSILVPINLTPSSGTLNSSFISTSNFSSTISFNASTNLNLTNLSIHQIQTSTISIENTSYNEQINASSYSQLTPQIYIQPSTSTLLSQPTNSTVEGSNSTVQPPLMTPSIHPSSSEFINQSTTYIQQISIPIQQPSNSTYFLSTTQKPVISTQQNSTPFQQSTSVLFNNSLSITATIEYTSSIHIQSSTNDFSNTSIIQQSNTSIIQQQTSTMVSSLSSTSTIISPNMVTSMTAINSTSSSKFFATKLVVLFLLEFSFDILIELNKL